jgi:hypothetical protein
MDSTLQEPNMTEEQQPQDTVDNIKEEDNDDEAPIQTLSIPSHPPM